MMDGYDAALHLLDRQVVDVDGRMVAKVDDVELTVEPDGTLVPTGLLVGMPAWLPRVGGRLGSWLEEKYVDAGVSVAGRDQPSVIELDMVADIGSGVELNVSREGLLRPRTDDVPSAVERWRLGELLALPVRCSGLPDRARVLDVRLDDAPHRPGRRRVTALVVGPGRAGALLGYDRKPDLGPAVIARLVRWLHRHAHVVALGPGVEIDRDAGEVRIADGVALERLRA